MNLAADDPESLTRIAAFHLQEVGWNIGRNVGGFRYFSSGPTTDHRTAK
jgi:hypothetical protein